MINRAKLQHILEYTKQQRHIGLHCKIPPEDMVEILEMAMLQGADGNSPVIPDGWVACSERTPEVGSTIMVFMDKPQHSSTDYAITTFDKYGFSRAKVTHWMPLPAAPQQEV